MMASSAPATRNAAARAGQFGAIDTVNTARARITRPLVATRAEPNRRISAADDSPATRAPRGSAATAAPSEELLSPSSAFTSGSRGTTFA